jgi:hypothetical protein
MDRTGWTGQDGPCRMDRAHNRRWQCTGCLDRHVYFRYSVLDQLLGVIWFLNIFSLWNLRILWQKLCDFRHVTPCDGIDIYRHYRDCESSSLFWNVGSIRSYQTARQCSPEECISKPVYLKFFKMFVYFMYLDQWICVCICACVNVYVYVCIYTPVLPAICLLTNY